MNKNTIEWFEIVVTDLPRAIAFYEHVFQVSLKREDMGDIKMALFPYPESGAGGALITGPCYLNSLSRGTNIIIYLRVDTIHGALKRAESAGGKVTFPSMSIGENGFIAGFTDLEGNAIGIHSMTE